MRQQGQLAVTNQRAAMGTPFVIGMDLGDKWSRYCALASAGAILEEDGCAVARNRCGSDLVR